MTVLPRVLAVVRDGGVRGAVVVMHDPGAVLAVSDGLVYAEAGVASPKVARLAARLGCEGAEFLAGVPGTIGGAVAMNAGCYGGETWNHVVRVEVLTRDGRFEVRVPSDYAIGYRSVRHADGSPPDGIFTAVWMSFPPGDATDTGIQASVGIERTSRQGRFSLEGSHGPSSGGALEGTSTDTVAGIRWEGARAERLRWDAGARWARRDPTIEGEPTLRSAGMGAGIEWLPRRQVGLRARADWVRQSGDETAVRNGSFLTASIGASWYPGGATSRPGTGRR